MTLHGTVSSDPASEKAETSLPKQGQDSLQSPADPEGNIGEIDRLLERIEEGVRKPVAVVFSSLLSLLNQVSVFENLRQGRPVDATGAALDNFRNEANTLVDFMLATATTTANRNELLSETLDGISFALSHDVKRIFDCELKALNWKAGEQLGKGKVAYIQGLLTNCLQQSTITLAQVFDPSLDGSRLFDNYKARLKESLILCRDLTDMLKAVGACKNHVATTFPILVERVNRFRNESMQFLMYRDWKEFETITESLVGSTAEASEPGSALHSFRCYLETLLGQVILRAVLVDVFCDFSAEGDADPQWGEAHNRLAFELYRSELSSLLEREYSEETTEQPEPV
jgi:hypothetical protein